MDAKRKCPLTRSQAYQKLVEETDAAARTIWISILAMIGCGAAFLVSVIMGDGTTSAAMGIPAVLFYMQFQTYRTKKQFLEIMPKPDENAGTDRV